MSSNELPIGFVNQGEVYAAGILLPVVEIVIVGWRLYLRQAAKREIGWDDYLIVVALVFSVGMGITLTYGAAKGVLGVATPPYPDLGPLTELIYASDEQRLTELLDWITWVLMIPANGLIKLSAVFLYRRLFVVNTGTVFGTVTLVVAVVCAMWTVAFEFATIFGCGLNVDYAWMTLANISSCNTNMRLDALMISDLITDIIVWLLPIPVIWSLNMKTGRKMSISAVFLLAAVSLAAAVVRLIVQEQISNGGYAAHTDVDLTLCTLLYWSNIETGLALIAACLPTLQLMFSGSAFSNVFSRLSSRIGFTSGGSSKATENSSNLRSDNESATKLTNHSYNLDYERMGRGPDPYNLYPNHSEKANQTLGINPNTNIV